MMTTEQTPEQDAPVTYWLNVDYPARMAVVHRDTSAYATQREKSPKTGFWRNFRTLAGAQEAGIVFIRRGTTKMCAVCRPGNAKEARIA